MDLGRENQYSIGIGGPNFAYWLDDFNVRADLLRSQVTVHRRPWRRGRT